jgi:uncharacterized repeat protein (TIGR03987 family)
MNELIKIGTQLVVFALVFYSIAIFTEQRKRRVNNIVLIFISLGILFDFTATIFMIAGSKNGIITLHGVIGYSALLAMLIDCYKLWSFRLRMEPNSEVNPSLHLYSRYAYIWWIVAFITGGMLAMIH